MMKKGKGANVDALGALPGKHYWLLGALGPFGTVWGWKRLRKHYENEVETIGYETFLDNHL